jgi:hypothetical protein
MTEVKSFDRIVQAGYDKAIAELPGWLEKHGRDLRPPETGGPR